MQCWAIRLAGPVLLGQVAALGNGHHELAPFWNCWHSLSYSSLIFLLHTTITMTTTSTTTTSSSSTAVATTAITMIISCDGGEPGVDVDCGGGGVLDEMGMVSVG